MAIHEYATSGQIHKVTDKVFADVAARDADTYDSTDVDKIVRVDSPLTYYLITAVAAGVPTFQAITGNFAPLASPALTGTPTAPTAAPGTDTTQLSTTAFVQAAISALKNGVDAAYDTLAEIATALGNKFDTANALFFKTISVSGQSDVVADSATDTLTLVAGSNVTITTDAVTDSITIAASVTTSAQGDLINSATEKTTPADTDMFGIMDSAASNVLKKLSWENIKTALNGLYAQLSGATFTGDVILSDNTLTRAALKDCALSVNAKGALSTQTVTFDYTEGSIQSVTCNASATLTFAFSNWPASGTKGFIEVQLSNGGAGTIVFPTVNWKKKDDTYTTTWATYLTDRGGETALKTSGLDCLLFWTSNAGTTLYGVLL